jgi:hypothetical protein
VPSFQYLFLGSFSVSASDPSPFALEQLSPCVQAVIALNSPDIEVVVVDM